MFVCVAEIFYKVFFQWICQVIEEKMKSLFWRVTASISAKLYLVSWFYISIQAKCFCLISSLWFSALWYYFRLNENLMIFIFLHLPPLVCLGIANLDMIMMFFWFSSCYSLDVLHCDIGHWHRIHFMRWNFSLSLFEFNEDLSPTTSISIRSCFAWCD